MTGIDFYRSLDMDTSIILKYPREMTSALTSMVELLRSRGKMVVDEGELTRDRARELVSQATGDPNMYYQFRSSDDKVWAILKEAVETDRIRILGLVHGSSPASAAQNAVTLDVGRSLHRKVSPTVVREISDSLKTVGKFPMGDYEQMYYAVQALCYEALYDSEYRTFPKDTVRSVPRSVAFNFMYHPPRLLTPQTMRSAVYRFIELGHSGWVE